MSMTFPPNLFSRIGCLRTPRLDSIQRFLGCTTPSSLSSDPDIFLSPDLDVVFPSPKPITKEIEALGLDSATATILSDAYLSAASRLRERCKHFVGRTTALIQSSAPDDISRYTFSIRKRYSTIYHHFLATWKKSTIEQSRPNSKLRHSFNRESLPLLAKYFDYNPYPSAADRAVLAKKTGLTLRQIEVWFQNHRNRSDKPLKRLNQDEPPFDFESHETTPSDSRQSTEPVAPPSPRISQTQPSPAPSTPGSTSPRRSCFTLDKVIRSPLAFPKPFQPTTDSQTSFSFERPDWPRSPSTTRPRKKAKADIGGLCESFKQSLNIRQRNKRTHSDAFQEPSSTSWTSLRYINPPPARHPAFVTMTTTQPRSSQQPNATLDDPLVLPLRAYKPLPRRSPHNAFLKYQHQEGRLNVVASLQTTHTTHPPTPSLRRSSSTSSMGSSASCSTPTSSPNAAPNCLPPYDDNFQVYDPSYDVSGLHLPHVKKPRWQHEFDSPFLL